MKRTAVRILVLVGCFLSLVPLAHAQSLTFADPAFQQVWSRTDEGVAGGKAGRSWLWGPTPISPGIQEQYVESPSNTRLVQYFDKARMEITRPGYNQDTLWYVTNGLLPIEMITGQMQVGDAQFVQRQPATIPAIGDPDNPFPTYADLRNIFAPKGIGARVGDPITDFLNRDGTVSQYDVYRNDPATRIAKMDIQSLQGIPVAFATYMQEQSGPLGSAFVFGYPVSRAYWVIAKVGYHEQPVMFQVFERRILTYTPANPPAFQVESGNVGQHYLQWRYGTPTVEVIPAKGVVGTTFIVRVTGIPAGEQASVTLSPPPYGGGINAPATIVGNSGTVTFSMQTTTQTSRGTWAVAVTRNAISPLLVTFARFDVTEP